MKWLKKMIEDLDTRGSFGEFYYNQIRDIFRGFR